MDVTVAICTWNRAALLDQTLARMHGLAVPAGLRWELLVVDNNCTDDTPAVVAKHAGKLPVRAVPEPRQGHCHARNRAVAEARGDLLLWTDDDVLVGPTWLGEYVRVAGEYPAAGVFGGPVRPWFPEPPPGWVARNLGRHGGYWALLDYGPEVRPLTPDETVYGANHGYRTAVVRRYPYDPSLGRVGNRLRSGDDTDVADRARAGGAGGVWVGTAPVDHYIPPNRLTMRYLRAISREGALLGYRGFTDAAPRLFGVPRWVWRRYAEATARAWALAPTRGDRWVDAEIDRAKMSALIEVCRAGPTAGAGAAG